MDELRVPQMCEETVQGRLTPIVLNRCALQWLASSTKTSHTKWPKLNMLLGSSVYVCVCILLAHVLTKKHAFGIDYEIFVQQFVILTPRKITILYYFRKISSYVSFFANSIKIAVHVGLTIQLQE